MHLKGYWYKGIIEDWYYDDNDAWALYGLPIRGHHGSNKQELCLVTEIIEFKERIDDKVMIFLIDGSCYELGKMKDGGN